MQILVAQQCVGKHKNNNASKLNKTDHPYIVFIPKIIVFFQIHLQLKFTDSENSFAYVCVHQTMRKL